MHACFSLSWRRNVPLPPAQEPTDTSDFATDPADPPTNSCNELNTRFSPDETTEQTAHSSQIKHLHLHLASSSIKHSLIPINWYPTSHLPYAFARKAASSSNMPPIAVQHKHNTVLDRFRNTHRRSLSVPVLQHSKFLETTLHTPKY
jgi:hypothetical protein